MVHLVISYFPIEKQSHTWLFAQGIQTVLPGNKEALALQRESFFDLLPLETCTESYIAFQSPLSSISQKQTVVSISTKSMPDGSSKLDEDLQKSTGNLWVDKNNHVDNAMHEHVYHERTVSQQ
jgi:hypothetical protein